jgi:hypothetical protein
VPAEGGATGCCACWRTELDVRPPPRKQPRCALLEGLSLHANTHLHANDRQGLERRRYGARGSLALERLSRAENGRIARWMKRPLPDSAMLATTAVEPRVRSLPGRDYPKVVESVLDDLLQ